MRQKFLRGIGCLMAVGIFVTSVGVANFHVPAADAYTAHIVEAGESFEGNPLKGFVPFDGSTTEFPHSMEWFSLPVSAIQTGMNEFDWTVMELYAEIV